MDALERHCIRGFLVDARFATKLAAPPSRGRRSCIWVPFPTRLRRPPILLPISSSSSSSSSTSLPFAIASSEVQADALTPDSPAKTVRVRFVLQKECFFGQQFFIVGHDPTFGQWDPANAIPLEWSAGHVWTAELDVPAGKTIQFKFILKGLSGDISWQPGPDRSLQTWETTKTVVISEDWDDAGCRKVTEEHRGVFVAVEPQSPELNFGGNNGAVEDQTPVPDSAQVPVSGSAIDPPQETMVFNVLDAPSKSVEAEHDNLPQETTVVNALDAPSKSVEPEHHNLPQETMVVNVPVEAEHDNSPQFSREGDESEGPIRNQIQEETVAPFRQLNIESEEVESVDGAMSRDKDLPKKADLKSMAGIIRNDFQWGGRAIKQFLTSLGIISP
ncbi:uncharacterized protein LOC121976870 isoform X2 [Zingiber officinale]|uniref:uncharacterized protein LOC121976870 isoform X2 n=1 Tax=Zingiber officinale TaxID=94328 RepID=UPI001C4B212F|nr:uncharacterized protein LOC121976870 isoform X2 [Zingiber officinale]